VRRAAVAAVESPQTLADIVRADTATLVRWAALDRLSDQQLLGTLAKANLGDDLTDRIMAKVTDRDVVLDVVATGNPELRFDALGLLPSFVVADLAAKHSDPQVRAAAAWVVTDSAALARIAATDKDSLVRVAARTSSRGRSGDLKVAGLDCKPDPNGRGDFTCAVLITNSGAVAYTGLRYVIGTTVLSGVDVRGDVKRLAGTIQPGENKEFTVRLTRRASSDTNVQFRLVRTRKAAPAG
jgi:hypothetical protein